MFRRNRLKLKKEECPNSYLVFKKFAKYICLVLGLTMVLSSVNWNAFITKADDTVIQFPTESNNQDIDKEDIFENEYLDNSLVPIDFELTENRTEYEKYFRKIDGTYEVAIYNQPVHYFKNGKWEDIDNRLNENKDELETKANKFKLKFPKKLDDNKKIKLKMDDYSIDWKVLGIDGSDAQYEHNKIKSNDKRELTNINQTIKYRNIQNNVDIEYLVNGSNIKENIVLNEYISDFSISFEYKLSNLKIIQNDEEQVLFVNENNDIIFTFDELYMFDINENISFDINYDIKKTGDNAYLVTITPDNNWMLNASYPVVIDPTLKSDTTSMLIYDTYISEANPSTNYSSSSEMKVSSLSSADEYKGLLYFYIPSSIMDKVITYSHLTLTKKTATEGRQINLYKNLKTFSSSSVTWNSWIETLEPSYDTQVVDYHFVDSNNKYIFDITRPVKEWQATGDNRTTGFTIADEMDDDEVLGSFNSVYQMGDSTLTNRPTITIGYEEPSGLKDYWTYTSQDMGMIGTSYISDYTGNLTFVRNDFSLNNEFMSLSLSFFYSNYTRNEDIGYGAGWRTSYSMQVLKDSVSNKYYLLKPDGDKVFYMNENCEQVSSATYSCDAISEDGSRMLMERNIYNGSNLDFQITTKSDIEYNFDSTGRLENIRNVKTNHYIRVYYIDSTSKKIDYVKDEADNRIDFTYDSINHKIIIELKLKQSDGTYRPVEEKKYFFDCYNNLDYISQGYRYGTDTNTSTSMVYDYTLQYYFDSDHKLINAYNESKNLVLKNKIEYQYSTNNQVKKVIVSENYKQLSEFDIVYDYNKTTYTDYLGKSIYYTFDNYGHTTNILDDFGNSTFYKYSGLFTLVENDEQNEFNLLNLEPNYYNNHHLLYNSDVLKQQQNPVSNHGFEYDLRIVDEITGWNIYEGSDGNVGLTSAEALVGDKSLKIEKGTSTAYASQNFHLDAGNYKVEAWIKNSGGAPGAYIDVISPDIKGKINKVYSTDGWDKYELIFTLGTGKTITIKLINESVSTAYFDNVQIVEGFVDSRYNMVSNNSFEDFYKGGWTLNGANYDDIYESGEFEEILGGHVISIIGDSSTRKSFEQDITNFVTERETFIVGGWAKANAVPNKAFFINNEPYDIIDTYDTVSDGRFFGLMVIMDCEIDGWEVKVTKYLTFDPSITDWQYQMREFELPGKINKVIIKGAYQGEGTAYFDNLQLYHDKIGTEYTYGKTGNLDRVVDKNGETTSYKYDSNDNVETKKSNDVTTNFKRNTSYQIEEISRNNVHTTFEYDLDTNQLTDTKVGYDINLSINEQDKWFKTSTTYTTDHQYINSVKDEFGNITTMYTDPTVSLITSITDALGNSKSFIYDEHGNIEDSSIQDIDTGANINVKYEYDIYGRLWKIIRDGLVYEFAYNSIDQITSVKIADVTVISYDYVEKYIQDSNKTYYTDILNSQTYGNGDIISFEYTDENQIKKIKFNGNVRYEYEYDSSARLSIYKDIYNNNIYFYSYDLAGRLEVITDKDDNEIQYIYDNDGNVSKYVYEIGNINRGVSFHYNSTTGEHDFTTYEVNGTDIRKNINYQEDSLRRLDNIELLIGANTFTKQIGYDDYLVDSSMGNATNRVYSIIYKKNGTADEYHFYNYDANHNITSIKVRTGTGTLIDQYDYQYDGFNQLVREDIWINSGDTSFTKYYHYDTRGNITDAKTFLYGQQDYKEPTIPSYYEVSTGLNSVKMYYNDVHDYNDIYKLSIEESPSLSFTYYDVTNQMYITGMTTTQTYSNLNISKEGYYYSSYTATDEKLYNIEFKIVFKVGSPEDSPNVPQKHMKYIYDNAWKDQISSIQYFKNGTYFQTHIFEYDKSGNPTNLYDISIDGYDSKTFNWDGRQLTYVKGHNYQAYYKYNDQGIRTEKKVQPSSGNEIITKYVLDGNRVLVEDNGTDLIYYTYDVDGTLLSMNLNGNEYFYITNLQGDIIKLVDITGNTVVKYKYDAWGNIVDKYNDPSLGFNLSEKNPYRYRGYRFDEETGYYYLNSRYYNPEIGRFINADGQLNEGILGKNMYAYTENNPVMYVDPNGDSIILACIIIGTIIGAAAGGTVAYNVAKENGAEGWELAGWTALGIVGGGVTGGFLGYYAAPSITGLLGAQISIPTGWALASTGAGSMYVVTSTVTISGAQVATATALTGLMFFASKRDLKMVNDAAKEVGVDRDLFGEYIHEVKAELGMKPNQNFKYKKLIDLAKELLKSIGR
ncbi:DNRLRE domain-containing protein [Mycoplasmatota bacterium]|nr:DNRLRE domain-containing protein [Mycoplasmatota bacterium]